MNLHVGAVVKSFVDSFDDSERKNNVENDLPEIRDARIYTIWQYCPSNF